MPIGRDVYSSIRKIITPLAVRVANTVARSIVSLVNDKTRIQTVQLSVLQCDPDGTAREVLEDCEHFQPYGLYSVPRSGSEAILVCPNGDRSTPFVIAISDRRVRPRGGEPGTVGLYTDEGDQIRLGRNHVITITTTGEIRLGSAAATDPVAKLSDLTSLKSAFDHWTVVPHDGGAALKAQLADWDPVGATKVKAE